MNREIKFRGKRVDNGEWVYGFYFQLGSQHFIQKDIHQWQVYPVSVGQFTGLRDRNEKDIYEGDVMRKYYGFDEIEWIYYPVCFGKMSDTRIGWFLKNFPAVCNTETFAKLEVIGNIHDGNYKEDHDVQ